MDKQFRDSDSITLHSEAAEDASFLNAQYQKQETKRRRTYVLLTLFQPLHLHHIHALPNLLSHVAKETAQYMKPRSSWINLESFVSTHVLTTASIAILTILLAPAMHAVELPAATIHFPNAHQPVKVRRHHRRRR